jgi:hypothetical protein
MAMAAPTRRCAAPSSSSREHQNFQGPFFAAPGIFWYISFVDRRKVGGRRSFLRPEIRLSLIKFCSNYQNAAHPPLLSGGSGGGRYATA